MSAIKKHMTNRRNNSSNAIPWLLTGFLAGGITVGWLTIDKNLSLSDIIPVKSNAKVATIIVDNQTAPDAKTQQQPKFDFYTILTQNETVVPEPDLSLKSDQPVLPAPITATQDLLPETKQTQTLPKTQYVLQLASYKTLQDADALKAKLALNGIQVSIQDVTLKNGENWHRVRAGPFSSINAAQLQKNKLRQQNIDSLILRLNG